MPDNRLLAESPPRGADVNPQREVLDAGSNIAAAFEPLLPVRGPRHRDGFAEQRRRKRGGAGHPRHGQRTSMKGTSVKAIARTAFESAVSVIFSSLPSKSPFA
jgi:hypothetical protein